MEDKIFPSLSAAAIHLVGRNINGWSFFLVDPQSKKSMRDLRTEYLDAQQASEGDIDDDDEDDQLPFHSQGYGDDQGEGGESDAHGSRGDRIASPLGKIAADAEVRRVINELKSTGIVEVNGARLHYRMPPAISAVKAAA